MNQNKNGTNHPFWLLICAFLCITAIIIFGMWFGTFTPIDSSSLSQFGEIKNQDGNEFYIPKITGIIFWWIISTTLFGSLISIFLVFLFSIASEMIGKKVTNSYISEGLPNVIEGLTVVYIILVVLLLAISGLVTSEGSLSILSAIAGYVLGKSQNKQLQARSRKRRDRDDSEDS